MSLYGWRSGKAQRFIIKDTRASVQVSLAGLMVREQCPDEAGLRGHFALPAIDSPGMGSIKGAATA